jgi:hypothetical protein
MTSTAITATVTKPTVDSKVGIDFEKQADGRVYIAYISGLFAETTANVGYEVISLNGKPVSGMNRDELKAIIRATYGDVSIEFVPKFNHLYAARRRPPPNCAKGGTWGVYKYAGVETGMLACLGYLCCGCLGLLCAFAADEQVDAYLVNYRLYDARGNFLTSKVTKKNFIPFRSF